MSDLIKRYGIERARRELKLMDERSIFMISCCLDYREEVRAEIADYDRKDFCTNFENGLSPITKVINK